ncbi:MAG: hypothetical protein AAFS10_24310 [Myxococcota bacterium]
MLAVFDVIVARPVDLTRLQEVIDVDMFRALPQGSIVEVDPSRVVSFQRSLNSSPVALNGPMVQARAFIVGVFNEGRSTYSLYVSLRSIEANSKGYVLFSCDPREVSLANYRDAEHAALDLVEGHGFVMEVVDFQSLSPTDVHRFMLEVPMQLPAGSHQPATSEASQPAISFGERSNRSGFNERRGQSGFGERSNRSGFNERRGQSGFGERADGGARYMYANRSAPSSSTNQRIHTTSQGGPLFRAGGPPSSVSGPYGSGRQRQLARSNTTPGPPVSGYVASELGMPPEEAIAILGRLLAIF